MNNLTGQKKKITAKNFLELLRAAQQDPASPRTIPQEQTPSQIQKERFFRQSQQEFSQTHTVEKLVFSKTDQEAKLQVKALQAELKKLAASTKKLTKEVTIAISQEPVNPGVYHVNYLERLRGWLVLLKKRIDESATWLAEFNQRSKKRHYYWNQVKKSGTKFMLSQERYMATQAG